MKDQAVEPYLHDFSTFRGKQLPQVWEDSGYFKKRKCHLQKQELIFDSIYSLKKIHRKVHSLQHPAPRTPVISPQRAALLP